MKVKILDSTTLTGLSTGDVTAWLRANRWVLTETVGEKYFVFSKDQGEGTFEVEVPYSSAFLDYPRRMAEVLDALELAEGRSQLDLVREIRQTRVDVTRLRIVSDATRTGRIPLDQGALFFGQARELMLAAACAAVEKRAVFSRRKPSAALDHVRTLRYGPSEEGSYVATIESPVDPVLQLRLDGADDKPPFGRRVMLTLAHALGAAGRAASTASATNDASPFVDAVVEGLNANLCDALAGILEGIDASTLEIEIGWAHSRPVPAGNVRHSFRSELGGILRAGARSLKERDPQADFEIEGVIVKLESDDPPSGGTIVVACPIDGRIRRVRASLDGSGYGRALDAHGREQQVALDGDLAQEGVGLVLRNPRNFRVREET